MALHCGVVGIHGFAQRHLRSLLAARSRGLVDHLAAVAHERARDEPWAAELESSGVRLVPDLDALLALAPDLVTLPVGIGLHVPMATACLAAGRNVYLEKPAAATVAGLEVLAEAERRSGKVLLVGFQDLFQEGTRALQRLLVGGDLGEVRRIVTTTGWPRTRAYFQRNPWAGRLVVAGEPIRDSIASNACAHFLNLALHLAGGGRPHPCGPSAIVADLRRGYDIETFDTCSIAVTTATGVRIVFNASHLGEAEIAPAFRIECARGLVTNDDLEGERPWRIASARGQVEITVVERHRTALFHALRFLAGEDAPVCRLDDARAHAVVIEAVHSQSAIRPFSPGDLMQLADRVVHRRVDAALRCAHAGGFGLAEAGLDDPGRVCP